MFYSFADDGRILTPPKELKPLLKGAFSAFYKLIGHIRFFYVADEIWDGISSLLFTSSDEHIADLQLNDGFFHIRFSDYSFRITDEHDLSDTYDVLMKTVNVKRRRPKDQLDVNLDEYPNGIRCDMCLVNKIHNKENFSGKRMFATMDRHCYYGVAEGWGTGGFSADTCEGKQGCFVKTYACLAKKGFKNCLDCGEYRACGDCGVGHNPGECNLGITAQEVTNLILPYCDIERLDLLNSQK